jgi:PPOX class probable F420-dependent enzyme
MAQVKTAPLAILHGHKYISLTTFRKNGQAVPTPVWFAEQGGRLYIVTMAESGKVKRIRANAQVEVAPCDAAGRILGASFEAMATIVPKPEEPHADRALSRKYGITKMLFMLMWRLRRIPVAYLEVQPM